MESCNSQFFSGLFNQTDIIETIHQMDNYQQGVFLAYSLGQQKPRVTRTPKHSSLRPLKIGRAPKGTVCLNQPSIFRCELAVSYLLKLRETAKIQLNKTKPTTKKPLNQKLSIKKLSIFSMPSMFPCYMHTVCIYTHIYIYICTYYIPSKKIPEILNFQNLGQHLHPTFPQRQVTKSRYRNPCSNKGNSRDVMSTMKNGSSKPFFVVKLVENRSIVEGGKGSWNPTIIPWQPLGPHYPLEQGNTTFRNQPFLGFHMFLVGGWNQPPLKNMPVKLGIIPPGIGLNIKNVWVATT